MSYRKQLFIIFFFTLILGLASPIGGLAQNNFKAKQNIILLPLKPYSIDISPAKNPLLIKGPIAQIDTISLAFIGDLMQHMPQINSAHLKGRDPKFIESYDYSNTFKHLKTRLSQADLACVNMECPLGEPPFSGYPCFNAPKAVAVEAYKNGLDVFFTANNHIADQGVKGILSTLNFYKANNYKYTGSYLNEYDSSYENPLIITTKGFKIAFINFTYGTNGIKVPSPFKVNLMDSSHIKSLIYKAKVAEVDLIIAVPHWGNEYQLKASKTQKEWAKMLFREGVKIIIGSHPHVVQNSEINYNKQGEISNFVIYSLGNFVSNQSDEFTQLELLVELKITKERLTNKIKILEPNLEYLWCFKPKQVENSYTVVAVNEILSGKIKVKDTIEINKLTKTYYKHIKENGR